MGTLTLLGYRHTNGSTRFGCRFYVMIAQPEVWVWVWLDALYLSVFLYEEGIKLFRLYSFEVSPNCFENLNFSLFFLL